ncbi:hypothetical protein BDZ97DRAFT_1919066 [Flammula alnicola]|nr:hypothetical protein BDZ97DRAFT_1919066 [Flammula alnicola]
MAEIPKLILPSGESISILDPQLETVSTFVTLPSVIQRKAIRLLDDFLQEVHASGSVSHLVALGLLAPENINRLQPGSTTNIRANLIDRCNWQLAKFLRYSTPTRIGEAVVPLTAVVEAYKRQHGGKVDVVPSLYLGVALSRNPGDEERAIRTFKDALRNSQYGSVTSADESDSEAMEQEKLTREWILGRPYLFPPSEYRSTIEDDIGTGAHITDHGEVLELFCQIKEVGPNVAVTSSGTIISYNVKA